MAAPLTGEEEALKDLKEMEAEARGGGGGGMVGRRLEVGSRSKMGMMGDVRDALERLKEGRKGDNLVQLVCFTGLLFFARGHGCCPIKTLYII